MGHKNVAHRKTISCGGVIWRFREGRLQLLLIKQFSHNDRWGIPKGHVDKGEGLEECALREIREETGVKVELGLKLPDAMTKYKGEEKTVHSWLCHPVGDDTPTHDDPHSEVADARWFDVDEMPEILMYQRSLIREAVKVLSDTFEVKPIAATDVTPT